MLWKFIIIIVNKNNRYCMVFCVFYNTTTYIIRLHLQENTSKFQLFDGTQRTKKTGNSTSFHAHPYSISFEQIPSSFERWMARLWPSVGIVYKHLYVVSFLTGRAAHQSHMSFCQLWVRNTIRYLMASPNALRLLLNLTASFSALLVLL